MTLLSVNKRARTCFVMSLIQLDIMFGRRLSFVLFAFLKLLLCVSILGPLLVILCLWSSSRHYMMIFQLLIKLLLLVISIVMNWSG